MFLQSQTAVPGAAQTVPGRNISLLACFRPESRSGPVAVRVGPSCQPSARESGHTHKGKGPSMSPYLGPSSLDSDELL